MITQLEGQVVSKIEEDICLYVEFEKKKTGIDKLFAKQKYRHRCREQTMGTKWGKTGWNELGDWD